jgi:hypothetical protein
MEKETLILCGGSNAVEAFRNSKLDINAQVSFCDVLLRQVIPLTWRLNVAMQQYEYNHYLIEVVAPLLFVEYCSDWVKNSRARRTMPGDFFVVPLMHGFSAVFDARYRDRLADWLSTHTVRLCFVGETVPADVLHELRGVTWKTSRIYSKDPLAAAIERHRKHQISVFDLMRLRISVESAERIQNQYFSGRAFCTVEELVPHMVHDSNVKLAVEKVIKFEPEQRWRLPDAAPIAEVLGVDARLLPWM